MKVHEFKFDCINETRGCLSRHPSDYRCVHCGKIFTAWTNSLLEHMCLSDAVCENGIEKEEVIQLNNGNKLYNCLYKVEVNEIT